MQTEFDMRGKVAMVTGASSGFGVYFAQLMAARGAQVVVAARRVERLEQLVEEIIAAGGEAVAVAVDVTDSGAVTRAFDVAEEQFGTVTVVSNNAGVADPKLARKVDEASWDRVMNTNLKGAWRVAMEAGRRMMAAGVPGSIVNTASILGQRASISHSTYGASKAAVIHLTRSLALEWARKNIRVNALCPGYFPTEMNEGYFATPAGSAYIEAMPAQRIGRLEELAAPFLLLASDAGSYVNGIALTVDGAHSLGHV